MAASRITEAVRRAAVVAMLLAVVLVGLPAQASPLQEEIVLDVPAISQHFSPADPNGDRGIYDCVPASAAMALQYLQRFGMFAAGTPDYPSVRRAFRRKAPNVLKGISPKIVDQLTPDLTGQAASAQTVLTDAANWERFLQEELRAGYPVLATVNEWNILDSKWTPLGIAHMIAVKGLRDGQVIYNDPEDGKEHRLSTREFARAWGYDEGGRSSSWIATIFRPTGPPAQPASAPPSQPAVAPAPKSRPTSPAPAPPPKSAPVPVQAQSLLAESIAAMRAQQKIELRSKTDLLAVRGSSHMILNLPDTLDGDGDAAGVAWSVTSAQGRTQLTVNGQTLGSAPSKGIAIQVRDAILSLPAYGSDWTVRSDKGSYRLEGRVATEGIDTILRGTGIEIPGNPKAKLVLTIDPGSKLWQTLDLVLLWPMVDYTFLGQEIVLGPAAKTSMDFGNRPAPSPTVARAGETGQVLIVSASEDEQELAKSTAEGFVTGLGKVEALKPLATPVGAVFTIINLRQAVKMLGEAPKERAALQEARQRYGEDSLGYDDALRRYREWQYQMPLVGPFLRFIMPPPVSSR